MSTSRKDKRSNDTDNANNNELHQPDAKVEKSKREQGKVEQDNNDEQLTANNLSLTTDK